MDYNGVPRSRRAGRVAAEGRSFRRCKSGSSLGRSTKKIPRDRGAGGGIADEVGVRGSHTGEGKWALTCTPRTGGAPGHRCSEEPGAGHRCSHSHTLLWVTVTHHSYGFGGSAYPSLPAGPCPAALRPWTNLEPLATSSSSDATNQVMSTLSPRSSPASPTSPSSFSCLQAP